MQEQVFAPKPQSNRNVPGDVYVPATEEQQVSLARSVVLPTIRHNFDYVYNYKTPKDNTRYTELLAIIRDESKDDNVFKLTHSPAEVELAKLVAEYNFPNNRVAQELVQKEILAKLDWGSDEETPMITYKERQQLAKIIAQDKFPGDSRLQALYAKQIVNPLESKYSIEPMSAAETTELAELIRNYKAPIQSNQSEVDNKGLFKSKVGSALLSLTGLGDAMASARYFDRGQYGLSVQHAGYTVLNTALAVGSMFAMFTQGPNLPYLLSGFVVIKGLTWDFWRDAFRY